VTNYNQLSFKMTTNVIEGEKYMFIAKAVNKWGFAELWSNPTTIFAATVPSIVTNVTSSIDSVTGAVNASWIAPHYNGANITKY